MFKKNAEKSFFELLIKFLARYVLIFFDLATTIP